MHVWQHLLTSHEKTVLLTKGETVDTSLVHSVVLDYGLYCANDLDLDVLWIRSGQHRNRWFSSILRDGLCPDDSVYRRVSVKYLANLAELKETLLNLHLFPRPLARCLILDDMESFCAGNLVQDYMETAAIALDVLKCLSHTAPFRFLYVVAVSDPSMSTTKLHHYFEARVGLFPRSATQGVQVSRLPHSLHEPGYQRTTSINFGLETTESGMLQWVE